MVEKKVWPMNLNRIRAEWESYPLRQRIAVAIGAFGLCVAVIICGFATHSDAETLSEPEMRIVESKVQAHTEATLAGAQPLAGSSIFVERVSRIEDVDGDDAVSITLSWVNTSGARASFMGVTDVVCSQGNVKLEQSMGAEESDALFSPIYQGSSQTVQIVYKLQGTDAIDLCIANALDNSVLFEDSLSV